MNKVLGLVLSVLPALLLAAAPARADVVPDLYSAEVPVADQGQAALAGASREALSVVLVKVSGSPAVLDNPDIAAALGDARSKVQQYAYRRGDDAGGGLAVRFEFDRQLVNDLVTGAGEPLWTANRPAVLAWFVVQAQDGPVFLGSDTAPEQARSMLAAFARRGVPARLPLLDLEDAAALSAAEVQALDAGKLREASARYDVGHIVAARINVLSTGQTVGQWSYFFEDERLDRQVSGADFDAHLRAGADFVATAMASLYAVAPVDGDNGGILMSVSGIRAYADYAAVLKWLEGLELVDRARVVRVSGDRLELRLDARADAAQLPSIIELNARLTRSPAPDPGMQLSYQWQGGG